ncbi:Protein HOTHEAD [Hordeum vulgare]|nr:Protein HOTHEAD [Hordeum vulgare]
MGSPQLLMLSGVGPADHLRSFNITLMLNQSAVGQGMDDNPMNAIFVSSPAIQLRSRNDDPPPPAVDEDDDAVGDPRCLDDEPTTTAPVASLCPCPCTSWGCGCCRGFFTRRSPPSLMDARRLHGLPAPIVEPESCSSSAGGRCSVTPRGLTSRSLQMEAAARGERGGWRIWIGEPWWEAAARGEEGGWRIWIGERLRFVCARQKDGCREMDGWMNAMSSIHAITNSTNQNKAYAIVFFLLFCFYLFT